MNTKKIITALNALRHTVVKVGITQAAFTKHKNEMKDYTRRDSAAQMAAVKKVPAGVLKDAILRSYETDVYNRGGWLRTEIATLRDSFGYKAEPAPPSPRELEHELLREIDAAILHFTHAQLDEALTGVEHGGDIGDLTARVKAFMGE